MIQLGFGGSNTSLGIVSYSTGYGQLIKWIKKKA